MKKKLQIIGIFILSFFIYAPAAFSQTNTQTQMNSDSTYTEGNDTSEYHSMAYYNYAKKNIIEDKSAAKEYKGKWVDSSKTETSEAGKNKADNAIDQGKQKMDEMKNNTKEKANEMKNDAKKKVDDMNNEKTQ